MQCVDPNWLKDLDTLLAEQLVMLEDIARQQERLREDFDTLCECMQSRDLLAPSELDSRKGIRRCVQRFREVVNLQTFSFKLSDFAGRGATARLAAAFVGAAMLWSQKVAIEEKDGLETTPPLALEPPQQPPNVARRLLRFATFGLLGSASQQEWPGSPEEAVLSQSEALGSICAFAGITAGRHLRAVFKIASDTLRGLMPQLETEPKDIYVCGGGCAAAVDNVERLDPKKWVWEIMPPMRIPRRACAMASAHGQLYVMGGVDFQRGDEEESAFPECFNPATRRWKLLAPMSRSHTHAAAASVGGIVYVVAGLSFGNVLDQVQRYDPAADQWDNVQPMPTPRFECSAVSSGGQVYVVGGASVSGDPLSVAERYMPSTDQWASLPRMNTARYGCASVSHGGKIFVFGGHSMGYSLSNVECLDLEAMVWSAICPMPLQRTRCGAVASAERIYVFGGNADGNDIRMVDCFDPGDGIWEATEMMPRAHGHCISVTVCC